MRSYPMLIDGEDTEGQGWTYVVHAEELIRDPRAAFATKRALELGRPTAPGDDRVIAGRCAWGGAEDTQAAITAAHRASHQLARLPMAVRKEMGHAVNDALQAGADELVEILIAEGHPRRLAEWETSGLLAASDPATLDWLFGQITQRFEAHGRTMILTRKPDGVVCINPPQNAAGSNAALGIGALLAGNALVVKAPKTSPLSVMFVYRELVLPVLEAHGAPAGSLNIVSGYSKRILRQWIESPLVNDIMFFGDSAAGLKLESECVAVGKKPILELAGNDCLVVWDDADLDAAARALCECFYGSSQICMVPKQAVVHPAIADDFTARFVELARQIRPGYPSDSDVLLSPVLKADRFFACLGEAVEAGCEVLTGGERVDVDGRESISGLFLQPTVVRVDGLADARRLSCVREETFFPLIPIIVPGDDRPAELLDRVVEFINDNAYGLRNSLWAADPHVIDAFAHRVTNGGLLKVNESHIDFASFLGTHGGNGRTGGAHGELHYPLFRTSHLQGIVLGPGTAVPSSPLLGPDLAAVR